MKTKPIIWTDFMTEVMKENARKHREWHRDRSCRREKIKELSRPATTMVLGVGKEGNNGTKSSSKTN